MVGRLRRRFLLVAFGWSWPLELLALRCSPPVRRVVRGVGMLGAALGAIAAMGPRWRSALRDLYRPRRFAGEHRRLAVATAFRLPPAVILIAAVLAVRTGAARWSSTIPRPGALMGIVVGGMVVGPLLNLPFALGEELGWRGFLFPALAEQGRERDALALTGLIWGVWRAPLVLGGYNYPGHRWLAVPLMIGLTSVMNLRPNH